MKNAFDFLYEILRHRKFILLSLIICTGIAIAVVFIIPVQYTASVSIAPPEGSRQNLLTSLTSMTGISSGLSDIGGFSAVNVDFYSDVLKSNAVLDSIIYKYDLLAKFKTKTIEQTRLKLKKKTRQYISASEVLFLYVTDEDPEFSAQLCKDYVYYLEQIIIKLNDEKLQQQLLSSKFLLETQQGIIDNISSQMIEWQNKNNSIGIEYSSLQRNPSISALYANLVDEKQQYYTLKETLSDTSFSVRERAKKIKNIEHSIDSIISSISERPEEVVKYIKLKSDMEIALVIRQELLNKINLNESLIRMPNPGIYLIDSASVPTLKSFPPRKIIVIIVFILVFMIDILIIGFRYFLKINFTPDELSAMSNNFKKALRDPFQIRKN